MCPETSSAAACTWVQTYIALTDDESRKGFDKYKGLIVSLPLLQPFSDAFVMQASLLDPPVYEVCEYLQSNSINRALWAQPFLACSELRAARPRCQLTAAATETHLKFNPIK